uniref:DUF630 domain-containing protein n=1 Tax=Globodera pallida TaxID=36090 RepID=A0A183CC52_GLOPA
MATVTWALVFLFLLSITQKSESKLADVESKNELVPDVDAEVKELRQKLKQMESENQECRAKYAALGHQSMEAVTQECRAKYAALGHQSMEAVTDGKGGSCTKELDVWAGHALFWVEQFRLFIEKTSSASEKLRSASEELRSMLRQRASTIRALRHQSQRASALVDSLIEQAD